MTDVNQIPNEVIEAELARQLTAIRNLRKPNKRGIMLLTQFIAGLMFQYGSLTTQLQDTAELMFWIGHNGDGTLITQEHRDQ